MKWLNKVFVCLMAAALLLTVTACDGRTTQPESSAPESSAPEVPSIPTAAELYDAATDKLETEKNVALTIEAELVTSMAGVTATIPVEAKIKIAEKDGVPFMHMQMTLSMLGQQVSMEMWQDAEYQYMSSEGEKLKQPIPEDDSDSGLSADDLTALEESLQQGMKEGATVTEEKDGYTITAILPGDALSPLFEILMGVTGDSSLENQDNVTYSGVDFSMTIDKESVVRSISLASGITMLIEQADINDPENTVETEVSYTYSLSFTVDELGDSVTVTMPEDIGSFEEIPDVVDDAVITEVMGTLFDEYGQPVANFDELYEQLAAKYGYDQVDQALSLLLGIDEA